MVRRANAPRCSPAPAAAAAPVARCPARTPESRRSCRASKPSRHGRADPAPERDSASAATAPANPTTGSGRECHAPAAWPPRRRCPSPDSASAGAARSSCARWDWHLPTWPTILTGQAPRGGARATSPLERRKTRVHLLTPVLLWVTLWLDNRLSCQTRRSRRDRTVAPSAKIGEDPPLAGCAEVSPTSPACTLSLRVAVAAPRWLFQALSVAHHVPADVRRQALVGAESRWANFLRTSQPNLEPAAREVKRVGVDR